MQLNPDELELLAEALSVLGGRPASEAKLGEVEALSERVEVERQVSKYRANQPVDDCFFLVPVVTGNIDGQVG